VVGPAIGGIVPDLRGSERPWLGCAGVLPVARQVELVHGPTAQAIEELAKGGNETNAILHVTC
jgi:hypothetical protein